MSNRDAGGQGEGALTSAPNPRKMRLPTKQASRMEAASRIDKFKLPLTGQEIDLQEICYEGGGMRQLRVRIRERTRFTTVDADPITAQRWAEAMLAWAQRELARHDSRD